jgi:hypothetical protein
MICSLAETLWGTLSQICFYFSDFHICSRFLCLGGFFLAAKQSRYPTADSLNRENHEDPENYWHNSVANLCCDMHRYAK